MKILFAIVDGGGNIPPQLAVARALQARGVQVHGPRASRDSRTGGSRRLRVRTVRRRKAFRSDRPEVAGRHHDGLHPGGGGSTARPVRGGGRAAPRCRRRRRRHDPRRGNSRDRRLRPADGRFRALLLSRGSGPRGQPGRLDASAAWHRPACRRTPRPAPNRLRSCRSRPDARTPRYRHTGVAWQGVPSAAVPAPVPRILVSLSTCAFAGQRRMLQNILDAIAPLTRRGDGHGRAGHRRGGTAGAAQRDNARLARPRRGARHRVAGRRTRRPQHGDAGPVVRGAADRHARQSDDRPEARRRGARARRRGHAPAQTRQAETYSSGDGGRADGTLHYREAAGRLGEQIRQRDGAEVAADAIGEFVRKTQLVES